MNTGFFSSHRLLRSVSALLILLFLAVQSFGLVHDAGHGFADHKHGGKPCEIHVYSQNAKLGNPPALAAVPLLVPVTLQAAQVPPAAPAGRVASPVLPRGPPALLQA